jgi:DNA-binding transcriptional ArsR family regulator
MSNIEIKGYFVDAETGEVYAKRDYRIQNKRQVEGYKRRLKIEQMKMKNRGRNWVAAYHEPIRRLLGVLSLDEFGAMIKLLPYMRFKAGGDLYYEGKRMGKAEVAQAIGKKPRQTANILSALVKAGVLETKKEGRRVVYSVAEEYHTMGETRDDQFTKLFQGFIRKHFGKLTTQQAGVLYAVLPFFHYKSYLLCTNPDEPDEDKADPMTAKELAEVLHIDDKTVYRHMNALSKHGIVLKVAAYGATIYRIHPDLMFRSELENEFTEKVRQDFRDAMRAMEKASN